MSRTALLASLGILGVLALPPLTPRAAAQAGSDAETRQLIERLRPTEGQTRGIRMPGADPTPAPIAPPAGAMAVPVPAPAAPVIAAPRETTAPPGMAAVSITVNFASGSAALTPKSELSLQALGRALGSSDLSGFNFRIEGHTDTVGDAAQNEMLSRRRAEAVREYLMKRHGISPGRLTAVGLGESQLLVATPDQVAEPRNRRVQVVNTGG